MMGHQHALGGAVAWMAAAPALDATYGLAGGEMVLGIALAAGAGMVPDLDQPHSTIGRTYGPVTNVLARVIAFVARGHRKGTHSLLGLLVLALLADRAASAGGLVAAAVVWLILGVAFRAAGLGVPGHGAVTAVLHAVTMCAVTALVMRSGVDLYVPLVAGMALGTASHVALDMLTDRGCPIFYPLVRKPFGVDIFSTGSRWTSPLVTAGLSIALVALVARQTTADTVVLYLSGVAA
jgi:membrane-bound metal-dependent hydrolase YbcI (DUF457 family)